MTQLPIKLFQGIFYERGGKLFVQDKEHPGPDQEVEPALQALLGKDVVLSASHLPPGNPADLVDLPGIGSCLSGPACRAGHLEDPTYLWGVSLQGVLSEGSEGSLLVGEDLLDLRRFLVGHYGRLAVCASLKEVNFDESLSDLSREAGELSDVLQALQTFMKTSV